MGLFDCLITYNTYQLFVGEVFEPHAFRQDEKGVNTGEVKASSVLKRDICIQIENGDYVSVVDGTRYSAGSYEQIVSNNITAPYFFWKVRSYVEVTGFESPKISRKQVLKLYEKLNTQYDLSRLVVFISRKNGVEKRVLGCYVEKDPNPREDSRFNAEYYPWSSFFGGNKICEVGSNHELIFTKDKEDKDIDAESLIAIYPELLQKFKSERLTNLDLDEISAYIKTHESQVYNNLLI